MRFPYVSTIFAGAWMAAAWVSPETNFFLFPFFTAAAIPVTERIGGSGAVSQTTALAMGTAGFVTASIASLALSFLGKLGGEPLGWLGSTLTEGLVLAALGGLVGAAVARTPYER